MRLLLHVGLNKCASTYIQDRLTANQARLRRAGVFYGVEGGHLCHYGLSRYYGFGPQAEEVRPRSFGWLACNARQRGATAMIVSSEYLSLDRPAGIVRLMNDVTAAGMSEIEVLFFIRSVEAWVRSLFNQYVRTVDGARWLPSINAYIDQVLANGAVDIAGRYRAWADAVGEDRIRLLEIPDRAPAGAVMTPFETFAETSLPAGGTMQGNRGLAPGALYLAGLVRRAPPSAARSLVLKGVERLAPPIADRLPVPPSYLQISTERKDRLASEVAAPLANLPKLPLQAESHSENPA